MSFPPNIRKDRNLRKTIQGDLDSIGTCCKKIWEYAKMLLKIACPQRSLKARQPLLEVHLATV
jgi:hypothetical protein